MQQQKEDFSVTILFSRIRISEAISIILSYIEKSLTAPLALPAVLDQALNPLRS